MKKVFALVLALVLAISCFSVFAEEKYSHTQTERAFGTKDGAWSVSAYDGYDFGADKTKMSAAPQKFTFTAARDLLIEWYSNNRSGLSMPKDKTYRFTAKYFVAEWEGDGKIIYCIDRCRFFDLSDDDDYMAPGYHETTIEWDADIDSDFINFYVGQNEDCNGVVYVSELKVEEVVPGEPPAVPTGPADVGFVNASWDNFKINGETNFGKGDGVASTKVAPIDGTKGDIKVIEFNGWAGFKQDIKAVGYSIDGKAVFDDNSKFFDNSGADKSAVQDPEKGGAQFAHRFQVKANVEGLTGEHKIAVVIKLADDTVVTLDSAFDALVHGHAQASANTTMTYNGPKAEQKPTGDVAIVLAVVAVAAMAVVVLKKRETI